MIETIYSNESGEADRSSKVQAAFRMPKNIRQVGKSNATKKIYVEDYVMTFVKQLAGGDYSGCSIAVLVGQCIKLDNCRNIFVSGAVEVNKTSCQDNSLVMNTMDAAGDIIFTNDTWAEIYEEIKKYFVETEIVGWFIGGAGYLLAEENKILKTHIDNFAGQDKILLTYDNLEKEETFLSYENNRLCKQDGYYIYYEKNEEMQSYIIDHRQPESIEAKYNDKVSKDIRTILQSKKQPEEENKNVTKLMYAAGTLLAVIVLIVGAAMLRNYEQMKSMQETLNHLSSNMKEVQQIFAENDKGDVTAKDQTTEDQLAEDQTAEDLTASSKDASGDSTTADEVDLDVEVVPGNVEPLKEDASQSDTENKENNENNENNEDSEAVADKELAENDKTSDAETKETQSDSTAKKDDKKAAKEETKYYTVKDGDTLADISKKLYNTYTKVDTIMELNGIDDQDMIMSGQKLIVP